MCKSYLEIQWKSSNKFVWDKNSVLAVDELAAVLLQFKKKQSCLDPTPARCILALYIFRLLTLLAIWQSASRIY